MIDRCPVGRGWTQTGSEPLARFWWSRRRVHHRQQPLHGRRSRRARPALDRFRHWGDHGCACPRPG